MKIDNKMGLYEIKNQQAATSQNISVKNADKNITDRNSADAIDPTSQDVVVHLSAATKDVQLAQKVIASEPDVRDDKVAEMKQKIRTGNYQIDHQALAGRLVDTFLEDLMS